MVYRVCLEGKLEDSFQDGFIVYNCPSFGQNKTNKVEKEEGLYESS